MIETCALEGCTETFEKRVHNQRFCSRDCCRVYTNKRILEQYHEKKNRTMTNRVCTFRGCTTVLSRYNEEKVCSAHQHKRLLKKLLDWGWAADEDNFIF